MWKVFIFTTSLLLLLTINSAQARFGITRSRAQIDVTVPIVDPWKDDEEEKGFTDLFVPGTLSLLTTLYGSALLMFSKDCPGQIHFLTMLRATGYNKIEKGIREAKRNIHDAVMAAIWRAPSFVMANRSIRRLQDRVDHTKLLLAETKKAKADGVVTRREARHIKKLRKRQIRMLKRDMKRYVKVSVSLRRVWKALDVDELIDILQGFLFQLLAVLATGHNSSKIGKLISRWCLWLNLGGLIYECNRKLRYPISKLILTKSLSSKDIDKKEARLIEACARVIVYTLAAHLVFFRVPSSRRLNASLLATAIIFRGIRSFVTTFWDQNDDDVTVWSATGGSLAGPVGGLFMIMLVVAGLYCQHLAVSEHLFTPEYIAKVFATIEKMIQMLATAVDKIV